MYTHTLLSKLSTLVVPGSGYGRLCAYIVVIKPNSFGQWQYGESATAELSKAAPKVSPRHFSSQGWDIRKHEYVYSICKPHASSIVHLLLRDNLILPQVLSIERSIIKAPIQYHQPRSLYGSFLSASYSLGTLVLGLPRQRRKSHIPVSCISDTQAHPHLHMGHPFHPCIYRRRPRTVGESRSLDRRGSRWGALSKGFEERTKAGLVGPNRREGTIGERVLERKLKGRRLEGGVENVVGSTQQQKAFGRFYLK